MKPSVGRVVHVGWVTIDREVAPYAAIVTAVRKKPGAHVMQADDESAYEVDLRVFAPPDGPSVTADYRDVPWAPDLRAGCWSWPPRV